MIRSAARALISAFAGAVAGGACLILAFTRQPALTLEMDRVLPPEIASGFYPVERAGETTLAWTSRRAQITLAGLSRTSPWVCSVSIRGGRSDPAIQPVVALAVDGITAAAETATNDFRVMEITAPQRPSRTGLILSITSSRTVVPGPSDPRELGVQIDRLVCLPASAGLVLPPLGAIRDAGLAAGVFGAALALAGMMLGTAVLGAALLAAGQAFPFSMGAAPYSGFSGPMLWFAVWIFALTLAVLKALERWRGQPLQNTARFVLLFSAAALYLKLLGLLHPSKLLVDAVFHAHRFEGVLGGGYYFTQPLGSGVSFPYAIGLYVFAAPWSAVTHDYVTLLRVVVCTAEVVAGALLYPLIARAWGDRIAAAVAVVLFNVVPLPYGLVGNANLTNAFGQSVALAALVAASLLPRRPGRVAPVIGLFLLCALAFLSHVSTFPLLLVTLVVLAFFYRWRGGGALHRTAWCILGVTVVAALFAVVVYYGHFGAVYRAALRVRGEAPASQSRTDTPAPGLPSSPRPPVPLHARIGNALTFTVVTVGWPILILAVAGGWRLWAEGVHDRAAFVVAAWGVAYLAFLGVALMRVDAQYQRYAAEFVARVTLATYPAAVMLAARGAGWAWRAGRATRIMAAVLLLCAVIVGVEQWAGWIQ
jgi:hypothetical protein